MKKCLYIIIFTLIYISYCNGQGRNHQWLLGYGLFVDSYTTSEKARLLFDSANATVIPETRKLAFRAAQGNISDENGNLLMASNGCWIMNVTGDTMMNGKGLNPDPYTTQWCASTSGIPYTHADIFLPMPGDSSKYILFHHSGNSSPQYQNMPSDLYYSIIDMSLDSGRGAITQKNVVAIHDRVLLGISACRHANGRDWWIVILRDSSDLIYKILLTPQGISSVNMQSLGVPNHIGAQANQPVFSPDGNKFAYRYYSGTWGNFTNQARLFDFDRCTGTFSNGNVIQWQDSQPGLGISFSSNSKYLYATNFNKIYQVNTDSSNIGASLQMVALNDSFLSPYFQTDFWVMYLAANGKIYISSGSSVIDLHYINYPDNGGLACDVHQHALHLPCYSGRGNVNHPNYYLGAVAGSVCDSLGVGIKENEKHDFHFSISPNPTTGNIRIVYMLPQNKAGVFDLFDINNKKVFSYHLPPWSTLQSFTLPNLANGIYSCVISSDSQRATKKLMLIKD